MLPKTQLMLPEEKLLLLTLKKKVNFLPAAVESKELNPQDVLAQEEPALEVPALKNVPLRANQKEEDVNPNYTKQLDNTALLSLGLKKEVLAVT